MKFFIDTEFLEGKQDKRFLGFKYGETKPTIDLISIGITCENGESLYRISKDFNLKEAWNRFDLIPDISRGGYKKKYWLRDNILSDIYKEYITGDNRNRHDFSYSTMKWLINQVGKSNTSIAQDIKQFVYEQEGLLQPHSNNLFKESIADEIVRRNSKPEFYGYYSDYDWVVFCQLFGKMIDLPKYYPFYCKDLKQSLDELEKSLTDKDGYVLLYASPLIGCFKSIKEFPNYPKQIKEHNALYDSKWNFELYKFIENEIYNRHRN